MARATKYSLQRFLDEFLIATGADAGWEHDDHGKYAIYINGSKVTSENDIGAAVDYARGMAAGGRAGRARGDEFYSDAWVLRSVIRFLEIERNRTWSIDQLYDAIVKAINAKKSVKKTR